MDVEIGQWSDIIQIIAHLFFHEENGEAEKKPGGQTDDAGEDGNADEIAKQ